MFVLGLVLNLLTIISVNSMDSNGFVDITSVKYNNILLNSEVKNNFYNLPNNVPIEVVFDSNANVNERVRISVSIEGYKEYIGQYTEKGTPLEQGIKGYIAKLSLNIPENLTNGEEFQLRIKIYSKSQEAVEKDYIIKSLKSYTCINADLNSDGKIDNRDAKIIDIKHKKRLKCSVDNNWCDKKDINKDGKVDILDISIFEFMHDKCGKINLQYSCNNADLNSDGKIDFKDMKLFVKKPLKNCSIKNNWCNNRDINKDGKVGKFDSDIFEFFQFNCKKEKDFSILI